MCLSNTITLFRYNRFRPFWRYCTFSFLCFLHFKLIGLNFSGVRLVTLVRNCQTPLLYGSVACCQLCVPAMITALQIPSHCFTSFSASLPSFPCYQSIQFYKESCQINPIYGIALQNLFSCQENGPGPPYVCVCVGKCVPTEAEFSPLESIALLLSALSAPETAAQFYTSYFKCNGSLAGFQLH